jgi:hypothetical protein
MRKSKLFFLFLLFFTQLIVFAQSKEEEFRTFKSKYSSKDFQYDEIQKPKIDADTSQNLDSFFYRLFNFLAILPWQFIFIVVVLLLLGFIAYRIHNNGGLFKANAKKLYESSDFDYIEENLTEVNLDTLISKAEKAENFPLAIRYLHYQNLQNLDKKGLIEWDTKKTNQQFINQIKNENIRLSFDQNTKIFNQIWFGEFKIDSTQYEEYKAIFNQLNNRIAS